MISKAADRPQMLVEEFEELARHAPESVRLEFLYPGQGLKVEKGRNGRARPDGVLVPEGYFAGAGEWPEPDGVLMVVEVMRNRIENPNGYAAAGIPVHLLIDRDLDSVTVHADPEGGVYRSVTTRAFGSAIELPDPVGFTLDTEKLKDFVD